MSENDNMFDRDPAVASRRKKRLAGAVGLLLAGGIAGGALAATSSASAAGGSTPTASVAVPGPRPPANTSTPVRAGEKAQTGTVLTTLKAAALKAVPGGTVYRVETDVDGAVYEAHMTKADGSLVTVKFNKNLAVTAVQNGMGAGGPGGAMSHAGPSGPAGAPAGPGGAGI
jgi:hypothetical protein